MRELRPHQASNQILASQSQTGTASETLEEWRPVVGYEGFYEVSNLGRVRGVDRVLMVPNRWGSIGPRRWPGRLLKQTVDRGKHAYGRLQVKLCNGGERQPTRLVHHLVMEAFVGPRPHGMEVAHNDGNPANNDLRNLRYATPAENTADKERHGTVLRGDAVATAKLKRDEVTEIRGMRGKATVYEVAAQFGISIAHVSRIQNGKRWGHVE